tara:strand:- start:56 stop:232 length:177 start_codon:yes stop_codon:yes gene_type:complete
MLERETLRTVDVLHQSTGGAHQHIHATGREVRVAAPLIAAAAVAVRERIEARLRRAKK